MKNSQVKIGQKVRLISNPDKVYIIADRNGFNVRLEYDENEKTFNGGWINVCCIAQV